MSGDDHHQASGCPLTAEQFAEIRQTLQIIANANTPNGRGWLKPLWAHQMTDLARALCDKHGWRYDQRTLYGLTSADRPKPAAAPSVEAAA